MVARILFDKEDGLYLAKSGGVVGSGESKDEALASLRKNLLSDCVIKLAFIESDRPFEVVDVEGYSDFVF